MDSSNGKRSDGEATSATSFLFSLSPSLLSCLASSDSRRSSVTLAVETRHVISCPHHPHGVDPNHLEAAQQLEPKPPSSPPPPPPPPLFLLSCPLLVHQAEEALQSLEEQTLHQLPRICMQPPCSIASSPRRLQDPPDAGVELLTDGGGGGGELRLEGQKRVHLLALILQSPAGQQRELPEDSERHSSRVCAQHLLAYHQGHLDCERGSRATEGHHCRHDGLARVQRQHPQQRHALPNLLLQVAQCQDVTACQHPQGSDVGGEDERRARRLEQGAEAMAQQLRPDRGLPVKHVQEQVHSQLSSCWAVMHEE
eukprot:750050-Hanusia_phi.AAC.1